MTPHLSVYHITHRWQRLTGIQHRISAVTWPGKSRCYSADTTGLFVSLRVTVQVRWHRSRARLGCCSGDNNSSMKPDVADTHGKADLWAVQPQILHRLISNTHDTIRHELSQNYKLQSDWLPLAIYGRQSSQLLFFCLPGNKVVFICY